MVRNLWRHRELIFQLTRRQILIRYQGSYLGIIWSFITPLGMLLIYTFVFTVVFQARGQNDLPGGQAGFALSLFIGLTIFEVLSQAITSAPTLIIGHTNYVKKVVFPLEILPISRLGDNLLDSLLKFVIIILGTVIVMGYLPLTIFLLPLMYLPLIFLCLGLSWLLAALGVFIRDIGHLLNVAVRMLLFLTPIFYSIEAIPANFRFIIYLNPLAFIVNHFRRVVLWGQGPDWGEFLIITLISLLVCLSGYIFFMKSKKMFADVI